MKTNASPTSWASRVYKKTGFAGYFMFHYIVMSAVLALISAPISAVVTILEPITFVEALLYTVTVRFAIVEYKQHQQGTNQ
ncbi:hypothetical protein VPHK449_0089 [Vibrio phage K449]